MSQNIIYTWKKVQLLTLLCILSLVCDVQMKAPFVDINTVHQAYSEFQVNLILNENRNHPIIMTTISNSQAKQGAEAIMQQALNSELYGGFGMLIDCREYAFNLNKTLGICQNYDKDAPVDQTNDPNFSCQMMAPVETKIKQKGHILMKNHVEQRLESGKYFTATYLSDMIKKNIPDFVKYIEDNYDLEQFLQNSSEFRSAKQPKLLYFDENLLSPIFIKKLAALLDGRINIGLSDQIAIARKYGATYDDLLLFQYDFKQKSYKTVKIIIDQSRQIESILEDPNIKRYLEVKKSRDMLLDFQHSLFDHYNFTEIKDVWNLQTHGRIIILEIQEKDNFDCSALRKVAEKYDTLFNYICYAKKSKDNLGIDVKKSSDHILMINDNLENAKWIPIKQIENMLENLPKTIARQRISTETQAQMCLRTSSVSNRDPIFYYFNQKTHSHAISIMNYLNSLPQVTSLLYFCQIYLPDDPTTKKFTLKQNTLFTLTDPSAQGQMKKMEHTQVDNFIQIKMFLRQISIKKMLTVYQNRLIYNQLPQIKSNQDLTDRCFNKNCIIGIIAAGRYRKLKY